jgi:hypothetical protein
MVEIMAEFHRAQYEKMYRKLTSICTRMELRKAIHRAAQRAAEAGVTETKRQISAETTLKPTKVGQRVKKYVYGSPISDFAIGMKISDTARPLSEFAFWPKKPKPGTNPIVEIYRGKKQRLRDGAFVQQMPSGHIGIFRRASEKRLPIREPTGPSVTGIFKANEKIHDEVWGKITDTLEKRVLSELHYILDIEKK